MCVVDYLLSVGFYRRNVVKARRIMMSKITAKIAYAANFRRLLAVVSIRSRFEMRKATIRMIDR